MTGGMYPGIGPDRCIIRTSDLTPEATEVRCSQPDHDGRPCRTVGIGLYDDRTPGGGTADSGDDLR